MADEITEPAAEEQIPATEPTTPETPAAEPQAPAAVDLGEHKTPSAYIAAYGVDMKDEAVQDFIIEAQINGKSEAETAKSLAEKFGKKPEPQPDPEPVAETPETEEVEEEEQPEPTAEEPEKPNGAPKRFRFADPKDAEAVAAAKELGISLSEYFELQRAKQQPAATPDASKANPQQPAAPAKDATLEKYESDITAKDAEIQALEEQIDKANDDMEYTEANKLTRQLVRLESAKARLEAQRDSHVQYSQQSAEQARQAEQVAAENRIFAKYPKLAEEDSMESMALKTFIQQRHQQNPAAFERGNWFETLANEFAGKIGLKAATSPAPSEGGKPTAPAPQPNQPPKRTPAKTQVPATLISGKDGAQASDPVFPTTEAEQDALIQKVLDETAQLTPIERQKRIAQITAKKKQQVAR